MAAKRDIIPAGHIERSILLIRGEKLMLDAHLAKLYGVPGQAHNQAVRPNTGGFPTDSMFRLAEAEKVQVVTNRDYLERL